MGKERLVDFQTLIGACAAAASTVSFTPQAWKIIRSRQTADISAGMYVLTVTGFALWTVYGIMLGKWPLIATNTICLALSAFILMMKLLPRRQKNMVADAIDPTR
jgi:MtN3 and saliva related transmembrane protein